MAKLPTLADEPRVSTRAQVAPTLRPGEAGAPFRQNAQIAGQIGQGLMQLRNKQIAESNKVAFSKSSIELTKGFNDIEREMDEEYRSNKPNFDGYAADGMERMTERRDAIVENAPESARDSINLSFNQKMARMEERFHTKEANQKSDYAMFETKDQIKLGSQDSYQTYDLVDTLDKTKKLTGLVLTSSQFDNKGKAVLIRQINEIPNDMLNGVLDREDPAEMRQVLADIDDPDLSDIFGSMDPKTITKAKAKLKRKLEYKNNEAINEFKGKYTDSITGLSKGTLNPVNPEHKQILTDVKNGLVGTMGEDGRVLVDQIEAYEVAVTRVKENAFEMHKVDPRKDASEISADIPDTLKRAASEGRVAAILEKQKSVKLMEIEKEPATYISKNDSGVALSVKEMISTGNPQAYNDMMRSMKSRYDQMRTPEHKREYMTQEIKSHFGDSFKSFMDSGDYQSAEAILSDFDRTTNGNGYKHFNELDIPKEHAIVSEIPDKQDRINALRNLNDKELTPLYEARRLESNIKEKDIQIKLADNKLLEAMRLQDGGTIQGAGHAEAMYNTVYNEYKRLMVTHPNMSPQTASEQSWKVFEKRYDVLDSKGGNIPISKKFNTGNTQNFIDTYTGKVDYVNDFDLDLPTKKSGAPTTKEEMNDSLSESGRWVYNRKAEGLALMGRDSLGKYRPVFDKKGNPIIKQFEEIDTKAYTEKAELRRQRKLLERTSKRPQGFGSGRNL